MGLAVAVAVLVGVNVGLGRGVLVGVELGPLVAVNVAVFVGVKVGPLVGVNVGVLVGVEVGPVVGVGGLGVDVAAAVAVGVGDGLLAAALRAISWARFDTESMSSLPLPTDVSPLAAFTACDCSAVLPLLEAVLFFTSYSSVKPVGGVTVVLPETATKASSISLGAVVVIWVKLTVAVELLYFPLLASMGRAVSAPMKQSMPPVAGCLAPKVQVYEAGSEAVATL